MTRPGGICSRNVTDFTGKLRRTGERLWFCGYGNSDFHAMEGLCRLEAKSSDFRERELLQGSLAYYGTYMVEGQNIVYQLDKATFPNGHGQDPAPPVHPERRQAGTQHGGFC
ncbi:MAG: hypothetical protein JWM36_2828 [Hyphomicrobiales bacterium]|nr:hypothetical protein [Hyphomicrobiales bacterium]